MHWENLLGHHHLDEFLVVDLAITIDIGLTDHFIDLLVSQLLAQVSHDVAKLGGGDETVTVLVEHLEGLDDFLLAVGVLHLAGHHGKELREINGAIAISIDLIDHVLELGLSGVLAKGAHDGAQLLGGDGAIAVLVEQGEGLLELSDLLFGQLISHVDCVLKVESKRKRGSAGRSVSDGVGSLGLRGGGEGRAQGPRWCNGFRSCGRGFQTLRRSAADP